MVSLKIDKEKKYILIAGAVLLFFGLIYRFSPDLDFLNTTTEEIQLKEKKLIKYRQMVREKNFLEKKLISLNRTIDRAEAGLLTGKTPALAGVDLQNILTEIVSKSEIEIKTMRVMKPEEFEAFDYLGILIQATFVARTRQLKEILYQIEASDKLLAIKELKIRSLRRRKEPGMVQTTIRVEGYMAGE